MNKHLKQFNKQFNYLLAVTLAIVTIAPQAAIAQSEFSRSPNVELGNFWNPNGIIYGYLGDFARNDTGRSQQSSLAAVSYHESAVNQNVSLVHRFSDGWSNNFDGTFTTRLNRLKETADADTRPMYSTGTPTLAHITALLDDDPAEIARVRAWANEYSASDIGPMFVRMAHESDRPNRPWNGNPQLFIDWWQKFVTIVETDAPGYDAPTDLIWVWSPTEFRFNRSFAGDIVPVSQSYANDLYPGADYVDWVGSSGYDFPCAFDGTNNLHNNTHEGVLEHATLWASIFAPEKPFILAEWGSEIEERGNGGSRAEFFNSTREMLKSTAPGFNQIGAIVYFDRDHGTDSCNWSFHDRVTFPNPELPFDQGANAQIAVGDDADFFAYRNLVNTPDMIAPLGAFEVESFIGTCSAQQVASGIEVTWQNIGNRDVNLRRDGAWLNTISPPADRFVDDSVEVGATHSYIARVRAGSPQVIHDLNCGTVTFNPSASLTCNGLAATHVGTDGDDVIVGTTGRDVIVALAGNDTIDALGGADVICAGDGDDYVEGRGGNDVIFGGRGNDELRGRGGVDQIDGGAGDDFITGNGSNDILNGATGTDRIIGGNGGGDQCFNSQTNSSCEIVSSRSPICRAFANANGTVTLSWDPVSGVSDYHVRILDGAFVSTVNNGSSWTGGSSDTLYEVRHRVGGEIIDIECAP